MKNKKSKYVQLIELYNSGKTNVDELKIELNSTKKTIYTYIYQANKEGKIIKLKKHKEKKRKISKYVQFIELYNLGVTDLDELEKKLESPKSSIYSYIHRAHKEGKIVKVPRKKKEKKKRINKYELFVKLYNSGIKETKHLMAELQISKNTVYVYTRRAQKEKKIFKIDRNTEKNITKQLITQYPFEVALNLNLQPEIIYKYLENLGEKERKLLQRKILSQNAIWKKIKSLKKIIPKLKKTEVFELIKFYYWCGKESMALQVINQIIYFAENSKEIKQQAQLEKDKLLREIMVKKIISRKGTTYSSLCKELNVRESFLIQILGREDEDR